MNHVYFCPSEQSIPTNITFVSFRLFPIDFYRNQLCASSKAEVNAKIIGRFNSSAPITMRPKTVDH